MFREKIMENENNSRSGKSQGILFFSLKFRFFKSHVKVREFQNFPKKLVVNCLLEILFSINCINISKGMFHSFSVYLWFEIFL